MAPGVTRRPPLPSAARGGVKRTADGEAKPGSSRAAARAGAAVASTPARVPPAAGGAAEAAAVPDTVGEKREKFFRMPRAKLPSVMEKKQALVEEHRQRKMEVQKEMVQMEFKQEEVMKPELEMRDAKRVREEQEVVDLQAASRAEWCAVTGEYLSEQELINRCGLEALERRSFTFLTGKRRVEQLTQQAAVFAEREFCEDEACARMLQRDAEYAVIEKDVLEKRAEAARRNAAIVKATDIVVAETDEYSRQAASWGTQGLAAEEATQQNKLKMIKHEDERRKLHNRIEELKGNIRVYCRMRAPLTTDRESVDYDLVDKTTLRLRGKERVALKGDTSKAEDHSFKYDKVFGPDATQENVFDDIAPLVQSCLDGFKVCIFAYGQTGSGKTYTMEGPASNKGVIPRAVNMIFRKVSSLTKERGFTCSLSCSFLEIYNDQARDLLQKKPAEMKALKITGTEAEAMVEGLSDHPVSDEQTVVDLLSIAQSNRACAATKMNDVSSRSHSIFTLRIKVHNPVANVTLQGLLNLIDLAGSEKVLASEVQGQQLKEAIAINSSLSHLGDAIHALGTGGHVPFRNCALTKLLRPSLGGSSKCLMLVNTRYAQMAKLSALSLFLSSLSSGLHTTTLQPLQGSR